MHALVGSLRLARPEGQLAYWAIGCLYLFAFMGPRSIALGQLSQLVMLIISVVVLYRYRDAVLRTPLLWFCSAFILYILLRGFGAGWLEQPHLLAEHLDGTSSWARTLALPVLIMGLTLVATGNWVRHGVGVLVATAAGLLVFEVIPTWSWTELWNALSGSGRYIFGMGHSRSGFIFATAALVALAFAPLLLRPRQGQADRGWGLFAVLRLILWVVVLAVLLAALFATKTRAAWLSLAAALPVLGVVAAWHYRQVIFRPGPLVALLVASVLIGVGVALVWDEVERRMTYRGEAIEQVLAMERLEDAWDMRDPNVGTRMAYKVFAIQLWLERPLLGHGPADPYYLMTERPLPPVLEGRSGHFHDAHVETLSRLGLVGYLLLLVVLGALVLEAFRLLRRGDGDPWTRALALAAIGFAPLFLVWMLGTHQLTQFKAIQIYTPLLAPLCASTFHRRLRNAGKEAMDPHA